MEGLRNFFRVLYLLIQNFFKCFQRLSIPDPSKRMVLITGCDSGFGLMTAYELLQKKYYVIALCLSDDGVQRLQQYCKEMGYDANLVMKCDVTKEKDLQQVYQKLESTIKANPQLKLWAVVNNAGIAPGAYLDYFSIETFRKCLEVNFFAVVAVTKQFLPLLKQCKHSRIINLSSCAGFTGAPNITAYSASKHAVEGFAKSLRMELLPWNIYVTNVNPGFMRTPMVMNVDDTSVREYRKASEEIQSQYPVPTRETMDQIMKIAEDPQLVVDCIVDNLTRAIPLLNNYPGKQAKFLAWLSWSTNGTMKYLLELIVLAATGGETAGPHPEVVKRLQEQQ